MYKSYKIAAIGAIFLSLISPISSAHALDTINNDKKLLASSPLTVLYDPLVYNLFCPVFSICAYDPSKLKGGSFFHNPSDGDVIQTPSNLKSITFGIDDFRGTETQCWSLHCHYAHYVVSLYDKEKKLLSKTAYVIDGTCPNRSIEPWNAWDLNPSCIRYFFNEKYAYIKVFFPDNNVEYNIDAAQLQPGKSYLYRLDYGYDSTPNLLSGYLVDHYGNIDPHAYFGYEDINKNWHYFYADKNGRYNAHWDFNAINYTFCNSEDNCFDYGFESTFNNQEKAGGETETNLLIPPLPTASTTYSNAIIPGTIFSGVIYNAGEGVWSGSDYPAIGSYVEVLDSNGEQIIISYTSKKGLFSFKLPTDFAKINICNKDHQCTQTVAPALKYFVTPSKDQYYGFNTSESKNTAGTLTGYIYQANKKIADLTSKILLLDKNKNILSTATVDHEGNFDISINKNAKYLRLISLTGSIEHFSDYLIRDKAVADYLAWGYGFPYLMLDSTLISGPSNNLNLDI